MTSIYQFNRDGGDNVGRNKVTNYYYAQDLTQAAKDIQRLLNQLESSLFNGHTKRKNRFSLCGSWWNSKESEFMGKNTSCTSSRRNKRIGKITKSSCGYFCGRGVGRF